ncbi:MAG: hypothetical protein MRY64_14730 [Hyphomonadaceae bacterium]|nr:hypothetical protein [Hyphomonadaceae bacterium]
MSHAVVLATYPTLEEALVVRGLLLARGLPVSTANRQHAGNDWGSIQAFGGVSLLVPDIAAADARQMISDSIAAADDVLSDIGFQAEEPASQQGLRLRAMSMLVIFLAETVASLALLLILILYLLIVRNFGSPDPAGMESTVQLEPGLSAYDPQSIPFDPVGLELETPLPPPPPPQSGDARIYWDIYAEQGLGVNDSPFQPEDAGTIVFFIMMLSLTLIDSWKVGSPDREPPEAYDLPDFDY